MAETVKIRLQLDGEGAAASGNVRTYRGFRHAVSSIARQEGMRGLHAGLTAAFAYQTVMNGCRLGLYEPIQQIVSSAVPSAAASAPSAVAVVSGALSGGIGSALASPLYLVKSRLQAQSQYFKPKEQHAYRGLWHGLRTVAASEGLYGLFRGVSAGLPRVMLGSATQLSSYEWLRRNTDAHWQAAGVTKAAVASLFSSLVTVTAMNPLDVVVTRIYQSSGQATQYTGLWDCARQTVRAEGAPALMKGWTAQLFRLGPHTVITFMVLEKIKPLLSSIDAFVLEGIE